jgi:hypothetical protein
MLLRGFIPGVEEGIGGAGGAERPGQLLVGVEQVGKKPQPWARCWA